MLRIQRLNLLVTSRMQVRIPVQATFVPICKMFKNYSHYLYCKVAAYLCIGWVCVIVYWYMCRYVYRYVHRNVYRYRLIT